MSNNTTNLQYHNQKLCVANGVDRITYLHESVVCHVLSRLPSKETVRTSILSKAWKYKWTASYSVDVEQHSFLDCSMETFIQNTNMLLLSCKHLRIFRFTCSSVNNTSCLQNWIPAILRHNLERFEVNIHDKDTVYPCSLLNNTTSLRELTLVGRNTLSVAMKNCAPNLISLDLFGVNVLNENHKSGTVTFNFPALKKFRFREGKWSSVECVEIYAPLLATFEYEPEFGEDGDYDYTIAIRAPRLTMISCWKCSFLLKNIRLNELFIDSTFIRSRNWWIWVPRTSETPTENRPRPCPCRECQNLNAMMSTKIMSKPTRKESFDSTTVSTLCTASAWMLAD